MTNHIVTTSQDYALVQKNIDSAVGNAFIVGATASESAILNFPQQTRWLEYYRMYKHHAIVHGSIQKLCATATSAGFDFVSRDSRTPLVDAEADKLKDFFSQIPAFISTIRNVYCDLMIFGNAYLYVVKNKAGKPVSLKKLAPFTMRIVVERNGKIVRYEQQNPDALGRDERSKQVFAPDEIIHFKFNDPINDVYGLSPLEAIRLSVIADFSAQQYNIAFFKNAGVTGTIISIKSGSPDDIERTRQYLSDQYVGLGGAHKILVIDSDSHSVHKAVATHNDMNFLEGRRFLLQEILAVLDVPPAKIGIMETANRSNSKEQDKTFRQESIQFIQYLFEETLNDHFIRPTLGIKNTIFKHTDSDTRDSVELMSVFTEAISHGVMTINEVRRKMGYSPIEGGDIAIYAGPTGPVPVSKLIEMWEQLDTVNPMNDNTSLLPGTLGRSPKPTPETQAASGVSITPNE